MANEDRVTLTYTKREWGTSMYNKNIVYYGKDFSYQDSQKYRLVSEEERLITKTLLWSTYECVEVWEKAGCGDAR